MAFAVSIVNPEQLAWYTAENTRRTAEFARDASRDTATLAATTLQVAQLVTYYNLADNALTERDLKIDAQIDFMQDLEDYKTLQDLPMLQDKSDVLLDLLLPLVELCNDAQRFNSYTVSDGDAIGNKGDQLMSESCSGKPLGWGVHDGDLYAAKSNTYVASIIANNAKRRVENFRNSKTQLVRTGQQGMKAVYSSSEILGKYSQAASIQGGLSDLFVQGFNSAGAALGVSLNRLSSGGGQTGNG